MAVSKEAWRLTVESLLDLLELAGEGPAEKFRQAILDELRNLERQAFEAALAEDRLVLERIGRALELLEAQAAASGSPVPPAAQAGHGLLTESAPVGYFCMQFQPQPSP